MGAIDFVGSNCKRNNSNGINAFVNPSISDQTYRFKSQSKRKWAYNLWDWYASFEIKCSVVHLWGFLTKFSFTCYAIGQSKDADLTSGFTVWKIRCSQYFFFFKFWSRCVHLCTPPLNTNCFNVSKKDTKLQTVQIIDEQKRNEEITV